MTGRLFNSITFFNATSRRFRLSCSFMRRRKKEREVIKFLNHRWKNVNQVKANLSPMHPDKTNLIRIWPNSKCQACRQLKSDQDGCLTVALIFQPQIHRFLFRFYLQPQLPFMEIYWKIFTLYIGPYMSAYMDIYGSIYKCKNRIYVCIYDFIYDLIYDIDGSIYDSIYNL